METRNQGATGRAMKCANCEKEYTALRVADYLCVECRIGTDLKPRNHWEWVDIISQIVEMREEVFAEEENFGVPLEPVWVQFRFQEPWLHIDIVRERPSGMQSSWRMDKLVCIERQYCVWSHSNDLYRVAYGAVEDDPIDKIALYKDIFN